MKCNDTGKQLIKDNEGCRLESYLCPSSVWTIGWGHTVDVKKGQKITQHQADVMFDSDLEHYEAGVEALVPKGTTENQFSALVSFAYNCGIQALKTSTLLKKLVKGDVEGASREFGKWVHGVHGVLPGLIIRREMERALFMTPAPKITS